MQYEAVRKAVEAMDEVMRDAATGVLSVFDMADTSIVGDGLRVRILREVDGVIEAVFIPYGGSLDRSGMYQAIRQQSERIFIAQMERGFDELDDIMDRYPWWQNVKDHWVDAALPVVEYDNLAIAYRMLYGTHVEQQRWLNAKLFDPQRRWVAPNGYRLSDRIWKQGQAYRTSIDRTIQRGIREGWSASRLEKELRQFVDPDYAPLKYTKQGRVYRTSAGKSYRPNAASSARRLARTEITRTSGMGAAERARVAPGIKGLRLRLSASHPAYDVCDEYAAADDYGLGAGVYPVDGVDWYPLHPHCMCTLMPEHRPREEVRAELVEKYRAFIWGDE